MKINEIENLIQKESRWELKNEKVNNNLNNLLIKILSFFSVIFSLSIIGELSLLGIELYLVIIFGIFATLLIVINEFIKVNKLISLFSFNRSTENVIISIISVLLSIVVSTYGIYKFLDRSDKNSVKSNDIVNAYISDTTKYFNNKINSIELLDITDIEPYKSEYMIYNNQLEQYISDRDNYKNKNLTYNTDLRSFYVNINKKIDKANEDIIIIYNKFTNYKSEEIIKLKKELDLLVLGIELNRDADQYNFKSKNNLIIGLFIFFTLLTEFGIIYISIKISNVDIENNLIKEENNKILKDKISFIKNTKEFKDFELYKNIIERITTTKSKGSSITVNEIKIIINNFNLSNNQIKKVIDELKTIGILSPSIRRVSSKVELDKEESLDAMRRYFEQYFFKY